MVYDFRLSSDCFKEKCVKIAKNKSGNKKKCSRTDQSPISDKDDELSPELEKNVEILVRLFEESFRNVLISSFRACFLSLIFLLRFVYSSFRNKTIKNIQKNLKALLTF